MHKIKDIVYVLSLRLIPNKQTNQQKNVMFEQSEGFHLENGLNSRFDLTSFPHI